MDASNDFAVKFDEHLECYFVNLSIKTLPNDEFEGKGDTLSEAFFDLGHELERAGI